MKAMIGGLGLKKCQVMMGPYGLVEVNDGNLERGAKHSTIVVRYIPKTQLRGI